MPVIAAELFLSTEFEECNKVRLLPCCTTMTWVPTLACCTHQQTGQQAITKQTQTHSATHLMFQRQTRRLCLEGTGDCAIMCFQLSEVFCSLELREFSTVLKIADDCCQAPKFRISQALLSQQWRFRRLKRARFGCLLDRLET